MPHAQKYYANILLLYSAKTLKLLEKIGQMGLALNMICPDHGVIWRKDISKIVDAYRRWSRQEVRNKALVIYDTMWHSTQQMAESIVAGLADSGVYALPLDLRRTDRSDIMTEVLDARALVIGSPTLNNQVFPTVSDFLTYMKGLKPKNRIGAAFGSYGWSGEAVRQITEELQSMKFDVVEPGLRIQYVPNTEGLAACEDFGRKIAGAMNA